MKVSHRFLIVTSLFITCLISANIIAVKVISLAQVVLPAAVVIFPLSYVFGDILTEVYGYARARRVIWLGFFCNLVFVIFAWVGQVLPAAPFWDGQEAYERILGYTPRLLLASFAGYLVGELSNSFVLARMKVLTRGRFLWARTIGSTVVGEGFDSLLFIVIAFLGTPSFVLAMVLYHWLAKTLIEVVLTPATYKVVNFLKRKEVSDVYDRETNFNPFLFFR